MTVLEKRHGSEKPLPTAGLQRGEQRLLAAQNASVKFDEFADDPWKPMALSSEPHYKQLMFDYADRIINKNSDELYLDQVQDDILANYDLDSPAGEVAYDVFNEAVDHLTPYYNNKVQLLQKELDEAYDVAEMNQEFLRNQLDTVRAQLREAKQKLTDQPYLLKETPAEQTDRVAAMLTERYSFHTHGTMVDEETAVRQEAMLRFFGRNRR